MKKEKIVIELEENEAITPELIADKTGVFDIDDGELGEPDEEYEVDVKFRRKK